MNSQQPSVTPGRLLPDESRERRFFFPSPKVPSHVVAPVRKRASCSRNQRNCVDSMDLETAPCTPKANSTAALLTSSTTPRSALNLGKPQRVPSQPAVTPSHPTQQEAPKSISSVQEKSACPDWETEFRSKILPHALNDQLSKETRAAILLDFIAHQIQLTRSTADSESGAASNLENQKVQENHEIENQDYVDGQSETTKKATNRASATGDFVVRHVEGATAMAYTPVRLTNRKQRMELGSDYAVSPVRRSARKLAEQSQESLEKMGMRQLASVGELLSDCNYAYTPNLALQHPGTPVKQKTASP